MAGAAFEVSFDDAAALAGVDRLQAGAADTQPLLRQIGAYGADSTRRRFATQAGPDGSPWAALQPAYADLKAAMGGSPDILRFHGDLMNSQHYDTAPDLVRWGSNLPYAAAQQFGVTIVPKKAKALSFALMGVQAAFLVQVKSVTLPARPYLGISPEDAVEIELLGREYLARLWTGL